jgi:hypothetical protein
MSLYQRLQQAKTEEDVKQAYIKALWLKDYSLNLIDIQTKEVWFEAKVGHKISTYEMFTQLLHYVQYNLNEGKDLPWFLCIIDSKKAAIMQTSDAIPLLAKKDIKRWKSASHVSQDALDKVSAYIGTYIVSFNMETHEEEFIDTVKNAIKSGEIIRTQITPDNLKQVFDKWIEMIGKEIKGVKEEDYSLLFFADIMSDGTISTHKDLPAELLHKWWSPAFALNGSIYELGNREWYRRFRAIYDRPPKQEYRDYLLERRDSLIPIDERSFKWAYYTPLHVVDKAYDKLSETLGKNRQKEYIVRDMCCGVGNLEVKHSNPRNIYMSTLDQPDIDVMKATKTCVAATRFQYDYLNDDITDDGTIDYNLTNKVPEWLRNAIASGKKILVLINPPYAEATNADNTSKWPKAENKSWVAKTKFAEKCMTWRGKASNELFTQFVARIAQEIPTATLAMFSKLKYINAPNFDKFREMWNAKYLDGFIVDSKSFEGLKGNFPIGFLIWKVDQNNHIKKPISEVATEVLDRYGNPIGAKNFYNLPIDTYLNKWIDRPRANKDETLPLINAISPTTGKAWVKTRTEWWLAYMCTGTNDVQNAAKYTFILSSQASRWHWLYITKENLRQASIVFTVQRIIKPTWINDRDQFLQPSVELNDEFKSDCLVLMLFNWSNLTASADDLERNNRKRSIINHFIPYTEAEVDSPERFESDFMVQYMSDKKFSSDAQAVLDEWKKLWKAYFAHTDPHTVRDELKLNRADVGRYQIRKALAKRNESGDFPPVSFVNFETAYKTLTEKLRPLVYEYGFLRV